MSLSDIILFSKTYEGEQRKTVRREGGLVENKMLSEISKVFQSGQELNVYFEVYNLSLKPKTGLNDLDVEYLFLHSGKLLSQVTSSKARPTAERDCLVQTTLRLKNFKPGEYILQVKVTDLNSGKSLTKEIQFMVTR